MCFKAACYSLYKDHNIHRPDLLIKNIWGWGEMPPTCINTWYRWKGWPYNNKVKRALPDPHQLQHLGKNSPVPCIGGTRKVSLLGQRVGESDLRLCALESSRHYSSVLWSKVRKEMPSHCPTLPIIPEADRRSGPEVVREKELPPPLISYSTQENVLGNTEELIQKV